MMDISIFFKNTVPPARLRELLSIGAAEKIEKGGQYVRAGEVPKRFAFVSRGIFRYLYLNEKGKEFTKAIILEGNFIASYSAMISGSPSFFFIEALEASEVFSIPYEKWRGLLGSHPFWAQFLLRFVEKGFIKKEKRERDLLLLDAERRYLDFLVEYPDIETRIPQSVIASYLGIRPESLSRVKKGLSN